MNLTDTGYCLNQAIASTAQNTLFTAFSGQSATSATVEPSGAIHFGQLVQQQESLLASIDFVIAFQSPVVAQAGSKGVIALAVSAVVLFLIAMLGFFFIRYGKLWFQAYMSVADVSLISLIRMHFTKVNPNVIVQAKVMSAQAGLNISKSNGISTRRLEAHYLAGGNVMNIIHAIIAAHRAEIPLDFDQAAAIDLAGRDVLDAVQTSVYPKVIDCPDPSRSGKTTLSAITKNGIELRIRARVTVRTNLEQLIGGATEDTVIARVGEAIISSIGSAGSHFDVLENPDMITRVVLSRGLDAQNRVRNRLDRHRGHRRGRKHWSPIAKRPSGSRHTRGSCTSRTQACRGDCRRAADEGESRRQSITARPGRGRRSDGDGRCVSCRANHNERSSRFVSKFSSKRVPRKSYRVSFDGGNGFTLAGIIDRPDDVEDVSLRRAQSLLHLQQRFKSNCQDRASVGRSENRGVKIRHDRVGRKRWRFRINQLLDKSVGRPSCYSICRIRTRSGHRACWS